MRAKPTLALTSVLVALAALSGLVMSVILPGAVERATAEVREAQISVDHEDENGLEGVMEVEKNKKKKVKKKKAKK